MTSQQLRMHPALAVSAMALMFTISAQAAASRTFVATTGNDSNAATNCGATSPCRSFTVALSVTNSGGEIVVLNSGGYGPVTISKAVIITAIGVDASITATSGNAITINTTGNVALIGLNLHGEGQGNNGVGVDAAGFLRLYNMLIEDFFNNGVNFEVSGSLAIYNATINDNFVGLLVNNASASAYVYNTSFDNNSDGVEVNGGGRATVTDSDVRNSPNGAFEALSGKLTLLNDRALFNGTALVAAPGGTLYFAYCIVASNAFSIEVNAGGTMAGTSPGTNFIEPGQSTSGSLGTPIALQ